MINPNERNINLIWHGMREADEYEEPISQTQQIQIWTSINNHYTYHRVLNTSVTPPTIEPYIWEVEKNGTPMYVLDDSGNPTSERLTKEIRTIKPLLSEFFNTFKPGTVIPIEVPTKILIN